MNLHLLAIVTEGGKKKMSYYTNLLNNTTVQLHAWEDAETKQATKGHISLHVSLIKLKIQ